MAVTISVPALLLLGTAYATANWHQLLKRATSLDEDPFSDLVHLNIVAQIHVLTLTTASDR